MMYFRSILPEQKLKKMVLIGSAEVQNYRKNLKIIFFECGTIIAQAI